MYELILYSELGSTNAIPMKQPEVVKFHRLNLRNFILILLWFYTKTWKSDECIVFMNSFCDKIRFYDYKNHVKKSVKWLIT